MTDCIKNAHEQLYDVIISAIGKMVADKEVEAVPIPAFNIEIPADKSHGDFASNVAMVSARAFHMAPKMIAEKILSKISFEGTPFERAEVAGPGFMNFFLNRKWFSESVEAVLKEGENYGKTDLGKGKRVLVEFVSANPTGPMHIGNARGGALGDGISEILSWAGYDVTREFYINDAGNQINKFGVSLEARYLQIYKEGIEMPEDAYQGADITEHANNFAKIYGDKYVECDSETRKKALVDYALPLNEEGLERDLRKYRIEYDNWFKESSLHNDGSVANVVKMLTDKGYTYEKEGAVWFKAEQFGADKDFVLVRSNGVPTYVVPDIAYHYNKLETRGFDKAIDIFGADHHGYVPRLKAALTALGADASKLDVILMQMVRLVRDGEVVKLSKRSGKAITLVTLLEDIPIDAARFFFNLREANTHFEFDLDLAVQNSSQNPVYYAQYANARICSMFANLKESGIEPDFDKSEDLDLLTQSQEIELIRHIASLPSEINQAAKSYDPSKITKYAVELAALFHKFYDACSVKNAQTRELQNARLILCAAVRQTMCNVLAILKVTAPEKM
jgi:arginyl-tRNA synthetase